MKHYTSTQLMYIPTTRFPSWEHPNPEPFGGFMWPPRSYTCTFCRREFRSAQALGGHMNVHRRDRARLKQSSHPPVSMDDDDEEEEDFVETKLSMGIDSFNSPICKRHKKSGSSDSSSARSFGEGKGCSAMEDIDLELRLGDAPAAAAAIKKECSVVF